MARLITSGFELDKTGDEADTINSGTATSLTSSQAHGGTYALQLGPSSTLTPYLVYDYYSANQAKKVYARAWIYISTLPASAFKLIDICNNNTVTQAGIILTPTGATTAALQLVNATTPTPIQIGFNSPTLNLGTWYCVELFIDATVTSGTNEARLNGTVFATGAGTATTGVSKFRIGLYNGTASTSTGTVIIDDIAVNDGTGSNQTGYPGLGQIVRATPSGQGDSNSFLTAHNGTAGAQNNYTRVSELTPDSGTTYNASAAAASDLFTVTVPAIPSTATINCVVVGGQYANSAATDTGTAFKWQIEKTSGGTVATSSANIPNSNTWTINGTTGGSQGQSNYPLVLYNDPSGNPWTATTIASMQIGYTLSTAGTNPVGISAVWACVDYTPQAPAATHTLSSLGVGN